jgi:hypothetical protein
VPEYFGRYPKGSLLGAFTEVLFKDLVQTDGGTSNAFHIAID